MMRNLRLAAAFLLYVNVVFQAMLWTYDYLPWYFTALFFLFFPTLVAVPIFLLFDNVFDDERGALFLGAGILMVAAVGACLYATRSRDYVLYATDRVQVFDGPASDLDAGLGPTFYSIRSFHLKNYKDDEIGAFYSSYRKNNSTTYSKTFAVPVFDSPDAVVPRAFLCDVVSKNIQLDNGAGGPYGFDQTYLGKNLPVDVIHGRKDTSAQCRGAAAKYLAKKGLPPDDATLQLTVFGEPPEVFYGKSRVHFWIATAIVNLVAVLALVFALRARTGV